MSRAAELARLRLPSCALGARLFPPSKWAGLFPSAAYRRSAPPQLAAGRLTPCGRNDFCGLAALPHKEQSLLLPRSWRWAYLPLAGILLPSQWVKSKLTHYKVGYFPDAWPILENERPAGSPPGREPHQTREPRGLSPSGGKTPAKPHVPRAPCAPMARSPGCRGGERKRVSSGHNRRRRLATGSRQPKRGFDTAVSKTTIEVADFYPCLRGRRKKAAARRIRSGRATRRATPMVWLPTVREGRKALAAMMSSEISPVGTSSLRTAVRN